MPDASEAAAARAPRSHPTRTGRAVRGSTLAGGLAALLVAALCAHQVKVAWSLGDGLSSRADPYSEADAVRSGEGFAAQGFTAHHGLPDVLYGGRFPEAGTRSEPALVGQTTRVYTHYPPGPNWLAGLMTRLCGPGNVRWYRLAPLLVGALGLAFYAWALGRRLGRWRGLLLLVLTVLPRMTTHMMHGLHYQGYAQSLLLVQIALLLLLLAGGSHRPRAAWLALFCVGFVQGWLSFDHAFLVAFAAVPLWLATAAPAPSSPRARGTVLLWAVLLPGAGFTAAHLLHFWQVVAELGGVAAALADFREVAHWRAVGEGAPLGPFGPVVILREYLLDHVRRGSYFGEWTYLWLAAAAMAVAVRGVRGRWPGRPDVRWMWQPAVRRPRRALALVAALAVCSLWIVLMRNHAHHHPHFLPRHYFLLYFTGMLLWVEGLRAPAGAELTPARDGG